MDSKTWFVPSYEDLPNIAQGYDLNNRYAAFPGMMSDGRAFEAGLLLDADENAQLIKESGITSNYAYRQYLQHNAESVIKKHCQDRLKQTNTSFDYNRQFLSHKSDLETIYLSKEELEKNKFAPIYRGKL